MTTTIYNAHESVPVILDPPGLIYAKRESEKAWFLMGNTSTVVWQVYNPRFGCVLGTDGKRGTPHVTAHVVGAWSYYDGSASVSGRFGSYSTSLD